MVALLPNIELGYALALVPVANVVLLVKGMLLGGDAAGPALVATAAMAVYAGVALYAAVAIFRRESVLFRTGSGRGFDPVSLRASRAGLPTGGLGILVFFAVLALMFFLQGKVESGGDVIRAFLLTQFVAILLPTLLFARRAKVNFRRTFPLSAPSAAAVPAIAVAAFTGLIVVTSLYGWVAPAREAQGFEQMIHMLLSEVPAWLFFACLAILPPVCEEILCRGFLLSAFRSRYGVKGAVVISAALFGALHLDLYRFPATFVAGLFLGYVRVRTGTLLGSILFHMVWNGTIAAAMVWPAAARMLEGIGPVHVVAAAVVLAGALAVLHRVARPPADIDNA
jgi:sodium transport system permease protein